MSKTKTGPKTTLSISAGCATVFFSSACLMILELAAGRVSSLNLGSSLYTWTGVIGVVLAGMTAGNYAGGRIADRFAGKKVISILFAIASISCVGTIILTNCIEGWNFLLRLSWPVYIVTCITILFFLPSVVLGAIYPAAAKAALAHHTSAGRTMGAIYAYGAFGSIAGTFLAGFWLISVIGTMGVIWATSAALAAAGLIYNPRQRLLQIWAGVFTLLIFMGTAQARWAERAGAGLALRREPNPNAIYEDDTQYCHILISQVSKNPDKREFNQDKLKHSEVIMDDITNLQYEYERVYAAVTAQTRGDKSNISVLAIGGGGFVFPRYLKYKRPGSRIDVAEIDPGVVKAAMAAFGLSKSHGINIYTMDGRNFVDGLIAKKRSGEDVPGYDFIYEDAFDNFSVPYQLVTREFNEKIAEILKEDGFYMLNLIDIYDSGLVLGSVLNTLQQTFRNVYVVSPIFEYYNRDTFVLIASKQTLDTERMLGELGKYYSGARCLSTEELERIKIKSGGIILTDDYAPMDNLAAPIPLQEQAEVLAISYIGKAQGLSKAGQMGQAIELYKKAIRTYPPLTMKNYLDIISDLMKHSEYGETAAVCEKALQYYDKPEIANDVSSIHFSMSAAFQSLGQAEEARKHVNLAIEGYKKQLEKDPNAKEIPAKLGAALAGTGNLAEAIGYFERAVKAEPTNSMYRFMLAEALIEEKDYAGAQDAIKEAIGAMKQAGNAEAVSRLEQLSGKIGSKRPQTGR